MSSHKKYDSLKVPLEKIVEATNDFNDENLIREGGFGKVYKGKLFVSEEPIDIVARRLHYDYGQGDLEFWNEIRVFTNLKLKHDNLVSFIGFCDEEGEKIIIYKHEANGSLDKHLSSPNLTWMQRLEICVDVARALSYLHCDDEHDSSVIHRNIKSSKILLGENMKPKLSGFELSKTNTKARRHRLVLADIVGTLGYVDPTYEKTGFVTHKSDVYSFGVVLFEVLTGKRAFRCGETEQHSPQYFTKQEYKDTKLDVIEKLDEDITNPQYESPFVAPQANSNPPPPFSAFVRKVSSYDEQPVTSQGYPPLSIQNEKKWSSRPSSFVDGQPSSFTTPQQWGSHRRNSPVQSFAGESLDTK